MSENFIRIRYDLIKAHMSSLQESLKKLQSKCPHENLSNDWRHGDEFIVDCLDCGKEKINIK